MGLSSDIAGAPDLTRLDSNLKLSINRICDRKVTRPAYERITNGRNRR